MAGYSPADWAGESAQRWASQADRLEAQLVPVSEVLFAAAKLQPGEHVLDVGCGRGATTVQAAGLVGARGSATGIDISEGLVDEARGFADGTHNAEFIVADAQHHRFAAQFDVAISRFGVMFFDDAVAALSNLRASVRGGGRLVAAVWQTRDMSELMETPLRIGARTITGLGHAIDLPPIDGGPFSLGDVEHARAVVSEAGWAQVEVALHDVSLHNGGPGSVDDALELTLTIGPLRMLLADLPDAVTAAVRSELHEEYARRHDGVGVRFQGAISIITAQVPA